MRTAGQPSGEKIDGDGTWGEGRPEFTPQIPTDKRGSQAPSIQIKGEAGQIPTSQVSMPDKRGGGAGAQGAAAIGKSEADARGLMAESQGGPRDACADSPTKTPDGTQPGASRKESPSRPTVHERVCGKGEVHSSLRGRPAKENRGGGAPDGTFAMTKGGAPGSPPQGPAGGSARGPEKSLGYGTAHVAVGSCAPAAPSMTVKAPPRHPALATSPPTRRPQPSTPAFGARAPLPPASRSDGETKAVRGLSVSQVHLSGPLSRAGPRVPRRGAPAEAPDDALAPDPAPSGAGQAVSPDGAFGGGKAGPDGGAAVPLAPTAQQAAAQARGGGAGGGGLTPAQEYGANLNKRVEVRNEIAKSQAKSEKLARALELEAKKGKRTKAEDDEFYALTGELKAGDAKGLQSKLDAEKAREKELQQEDAKVAAANRKSAKNLSPTEQARALKEAERQRKQDDRQREIQERLEEKRRRREERNAKRPDYRATQRAKARRANNKRTKSLNKAKKLLKAAKNKNLSKSARKKAIEKAKKAAEKAKEAGRAKVEAMKKAGDEKGAKEEERRQAEENAALDQEIEQAEAGIDNGVRSEPQPDPCSLPCECTIKDCDPPDWCICFRWPADPGGDDGGDGGGGGAATPAPPEIQLPEGSTVAEEKNGEGGGEDDEGATGSGGSTLSLTAGLGVPTFGYALFSIDTGYLGWLPLLLLGGDEEAEKIWKEREEKAQSETYDELLDELDTFTDYDEKRRKALEEEKARLKKGGLSATEKKKLEENIARLEQEGNDLSRLIGILKAAMEKKKAIGMKGFADSRHEEHDALIRRIVHDFNKDKAAFAKCTEEQAKQIPDLTPEFVKAWLIQEAGGSDKRSLAAWPVDPAQVNVPGDWSNYKKVYGLKEPEKRNEGTIDTNLRAAVGYLAAKGFGKSGQPPENRPSGTFDGWSKATERYNGRTDATTNGKTHSENYAAAIAARAGNLGKHVPIELPGLIGR